MLDPWIIEEIRRREEEERAEREQRPAIELPIFEMPRAERPDMGEKPESDGERGVAIIDFTVV